MKIRILKSFPFLIIFFIIDWLCCSSLIEAYKLGRLTERQLLFSMAEAGSQCTMEYILICLIPYCIFYTYISGRTTIAALIRIPSRKYHLQKQFCKIVISSSIFTFIHEITAWIGTAIYISLFELQAGRWFEASAIHCFSVFLFYIQVGLIYEICGCLSGDKLRLLYTFIPYAGLQYLLNAHIIKWTPFTNFALLKGIMSRDLSASTIIFILIWETILILILYQLEQYLFRRKDLL
ncbi:MAG: WxPxxD family membrane protein [Lachnospiraceae bacterium]|nr:WxPxxD family membrane protein [Lachnospiraceae bacterium]